MTFQICGCNRVTEKIRIGVYFHIIEVRDHNNAIMKTMTVTSHYKIIQIQGHDLFFVTFHFSGCIRAIGKISVSYVYIHILQVKDHTIDIKI